MTGIIGDLTPHPERLKEAAARGFSTATDLADWLVRELGLPFRDAHHVTGRIVALAEKAECRLDQLLLQDMQKVEPRITDGVMSVLSVDASVASRRAYGGTAPDNVKAQAQRWIAALKKE